MILHITARKNEGHVDPLDDEARQFATPVSDINTTPGQLAKAAAAAVEAQFGPEWRVSSFMS